MKNAPKRVRFSFDTESFDRVPGIGKRDERGGAAGGESGDRNEGAAVEIAPSDDGQSNFGHLKPLGFHKFGRARHRFLERDSSQVMYL